LPFEDILFRAILCLLTNAYAGERIG
jgi:hypothetical protein